MFYDVTTLYFEIDSEDELRKTSFSKVGKVPINKTGRTLADEMKYGVLHPVRSYESREVDKADEISGSINYNREFYKSFPALYNACHR